MTPTDKATLLRVAQWTMQNKRKLVSKIRELAETEENYLLFIRELDRVEAQLRRARCMGAIATLTLPQWFATLDYFNWLCAYCQQKPFRVMLHVHALPEGGTTIYNCIPVCYSCRSIKDHDNTPILTYFASIEQD